MDYLIPLPVLIPLLSAGFALVVGRRPRLQQLIAVLAMLAATGVGIFLLTGAPLAEDVGSWAAPIGITLVADRLAVLMLVVSQIVTLAVLLYSVAQNVADPVPTTPVAIFYPTLLVLSAGVSNSFLTGDLFNLYVGFEILLAASFVLITLGGTRGRIRAGTVYVVVSLVSSILFLVAIAWIYGATGTVNMAQLSQRLSEVQGAQYIEVMLLVAFGVKAAIFPLSAWLPDSYPTAPAPVTAVFAGLLTKVGIYAIIRLEFVVFPGDHFATLLGFAGIFTMILGMLGAIAQDDAKRLLSFTLVSHIGFMVWGIALGSAAGLAAAIYYALHHIIVQTALFLVVGLIERRSATTSLSRLYGLAKYAPALAIMYLITALNMVGLPPLTGFLGKLGLAEASVQVGTPMAWWLLGAGIFTSFLTLYVAIKFWNKAFWQPKEAEFEDFPQSSGRAQARVQRALEAGRVGQIDVAVSEASRTEQELAGGQSSRFMYATVGGLVAVQILMAAFSGPIYEYTDLAAANLTTPGAYADLVLGVEGRGEGDSSEVAEPLVVPPWIEPELFRPPLLPQDNLPDVEGGQE